MQVDTHIKRGRKIRRLIDGCTRVFLEINIVLAPVKPGGKPVAANQPYREIEHFYQYPDIRTDILTHQETLLEISDTGPHIECLDETHPVIDIFHSIEIFQIDTAVDTGKLAQKKRERQFETVADRKPDIRIGREFHIGQSGRLFDSDRGKNIVIEQQSQSAANISQHERTCYTDSTFQIQDGLPFGVGQGRQRRLSLTQTDTQHGEVIEAQVRAKADLQYREPLDIIHPESRGVHKNNTETCRIGNTSAACRNHIYRLGKFYFLLYPVSCTGKNGGYRDK